MKSMWENYRIISAKYHEIVILHQLTWNYSLLTINADEDMYVEFQKLKLKIKIMTLISKWPYGIMHSPPALTLDSDRSFRYVKITKKTSFCYDF